MFSVNTQVSRVPWQVIYQWGQGTFPSVPFKDSLLIIFLSFQSLCKFWGHSLLTLISVSTLAVLSEVRSVSPVLDISFIITDAGWLVKNHLCGLRQQILSPGPHSKEITWEVINMAQSWKHSSCQHKDTHTCPHTHTFTHQRTPSEKPKELPVSVFPAGMNSHRT